MNRTLVVLTIAALLIPAGGTAGPAESPEPAAPWWATTLLDRDRDGLDDALSHAVGLVRVLVHYRHAPGADDVAALAREGAVVHSVFRSVPTVWATLPATALAAVSGLPGVVLVEQDAPVRPTLDETRPSVRADAAVRVHGIIGRGVAIAVFDAGFEETHRDFAGRVLASFDATLPQEVGGVLGSGVPVVPESTRGHGTHVAGVAAGSGAASAGRYAGVAPGAGLVNIKVFDGNDEGSVGNVLRGLDWVEARKSELGVRILLMSLGGRATDGTDALSRAIDAAADRGLLTVASAGNGGPDAHTVGVPGVARRALTVGAVHKSLAIADFSARGPTVDGRAKPDLVAPGVDVTAPLPSAAAGGGSYGALSGTSMSAPHVAGAAALLFEAQPALSPSAVKWILLASSRNLGPAHDAWHPAYGWGFLDVLTAVSAAKNASVLAKPPHAGKARAVPVDDGGELLARFGFETGPSMRSTAAEPAPAAAMVFAAAAAVALFRRRR
ncbi:MAG TPA: S8 family serine peptidase [Candidatus Thermoplasmatota archaeon]|nr:S8 family serine peptidase [Candidatus Thermoplasmatota archaeon]